VCTLSTISISGAKLLSLYLFSAKNSGKLQKKALINMLISTMIMKGCYNYMVILELLTRLSTYLSTIFLRFEV